MLCREIVLAEDVGLNVSRRDTGGRQALGLDFLFNLVIHISPLLVY